MQPSPVIQYAPAKVNLYLHITGQREDGYHLLDSLVVFAEMGDELRIETALDFELAITGPFAALVPQAGNLVERAARAVCTRINRKPECRITLTKNIPVGAGLGGGSADAAATVRGVLDFFARRAQVDDLLLDLGADVPACYQSVPLRISGIGEIIEPVTPFPALHTLMINPLTSCSTRDVFHSYKGDTHRVVCPLPGGFTDADTLIDWLGDTQNDLTDAASALVPEIDKALATLESCHPRLARMSGSGATCFALFDTKEQCLEAEQIVHEAHPGWWIRATRLGAT